MSRENWREILIRFAPEWQRTGISPEDWCNREGYAWKSAKRYITIKAVKVYLETGEFIWVNKTANSQKETANRTANSQMQKAEKKTLKVMSGNQRENKK